MFCLRAARCSRAGLFFSAQAPSGTQGPSPALHRGDALNWRASIGTTVHTRLTRLRGAAHATCPCSRCRASTAFGPSQDLQEGRSPQAWKLCTPAHYTLSLYWNHIGVKRKVRLGNGVWPFLSIESRAGCHTHTLRLYLKLHYELATLAIPHTKLLRPHPISIMGNRYVTRAAHSRTAPLWFFFWETGGWRVPG